MISLENYKKNTKLYVLLLTFNVNRDHLLFSIALQLSKSWRAIPGKDSFSNKFQIQKLAFHFNFFESNEDGSFSIKKKTEQFNLEIVERVI